MSEFLEIEGKTAVAIMFSGGVESTACIQHALDKDYYPLCFFVSMFPNVKVHRPRVKAICTLYGVDLYELPLDQREFDKSAAISDNTYHWMALYGAMITLVYPKLKYVWVGVSSGIRSSTDFDNWPRSLFEDYSKCLALIESASTMVGGRAIADMPLWKLTKKQQWGTLGEEVQSLLVTCENQLEVGQPRCHACSKCDELDSVWDDEKYAEWTRRYGCS